MHDKLGGEGEVHDQRDVHSDCDRKEDRAAQRERQREQQSSDSKSNRHWRLGSFRFHEPAPQRCGAFLCAEHVRQLEGESPFHNQMEVK